MDSTRPAETLASLSSEGEAKPTDMLLFCPKCGAQHVDAPAEPEHGEEGRPIRWTNPPHRSHLCHACGCIWRPADVPTNGVAMIGSVGKADTWRGYETAALATPTPADVIEKCAAIVDDAARTWSWEAGEEEGFAYRNKACAERRQQWPDTDDDCDQDGSCYECKVDMHMHFETHESKERRAELHRLAAAIRALSSKEGQL